MSYHLIIPTLWLVWFLIWAVMSLRVKATAKREHVVHLVAHMLPLIVAALLLAAPDVPIFPLDARFLPPDVLYVRLGRALTFAGLAFAVWARLLLAGNWSGGVTLKHDHELVVTGPYRWVRHPIYTGLLLALAGTALAIGEGRALLALGIAAVALWWKLRREEAVMLRQFGEAYTHYARRTRSLVPFVL